MNGGSPREPPLPRVAVGGVTTAGANSRHHDGGGIAPAAGLAFGADLAHARPERRTGREPAQISAAAGQGTFVTPVRDGGELSGAIGARLEILPLGAFPTRQPFPIGIGVVHRAAHAAYIHQPPCAAGHFRRVLFQAGAAFLVRLLTIVLLAHDVGWASDDPAHRAALPTGE